MHLAKQ
jgi:NADH dehydrogenase